MKSEKVIRVLEVLLVIALLGAAAYMRCRQLIPLPEEAEYLTRSYVTSNGPQTEGLGRALEVAYVYVLHGIMGLLGNRHIVALVAQIAIQLLAALLLYLATRQMAHPVPGIALLAYVAFAPEMVRLGSTNSPQLC